MNGGINVAASNDLLSTLLQGGSLETLSKLSGAGKGQVQQVLTDAVPTLVQNMQKNASTKSGEKALSSALSTHAEDDTSDVSSFLKNVNLEDGGKILTHILGGKKSSLESGIAGKSGLTSDQTATILSAAAPLLLSVLGSKQKEKAGKDSSGGLMDILTSALFGGGDSEDKPKEKDDGFDLGDAATLLLGGSKDNGSKSDGLSDLLIGGLGSLLGGDSGKKSTTKKKTTTSTKKKTPTAKKKSTTKKTTPKKKK
jgi:hypothetical protein